MFKYDLRPFGRRWRKMYVQNMSSFVAAMFERFISFNLHKSKITFLISLKLVSLFLNIILTICLQRMSPLWRHIWVNISYVFFYLRPQLLERRCINDKPESIEHWENNIWRVIRWKQLPNCNMSRYCLELSKITNKLVNLLSYRPKLLTINPSDPVVFWETSDICFTIW